MVGRPPPAGGPLEQLLWHLLAGQRGSLNRLRILEELLLEPQNAQQLAGLLSVDYRTVRHHIDILAENGLIARLEGNGYGARLFVSGQLRANLATFQEIRNYIRKDAPGAPAKRRLPTETAGGA
jgi:DNA-binding transcriptional ArsR family regulator